MNQHLSIEQLTDLKHEPESADDKIINHLIDCPACRSKIEALDSFFQEQVLAFDGNVNNISQIDRTKDKFSWPNNAAEQKSLLTGLLLSNDIENNAQKVDHAANLKKPNLFSLLVPLWAAAACVLISFVVSIMLMSSPQQSLLAVYQDPEGLTVNEATIGIGFFQESQQIRRNIDAVTLTKSDNNTLQMNWPAFAESGTYTLEIHEQNGTQIFNKQLTKSQASIPLTLVKPGRNYQWLLSLKDENNIQYHLPGGFVLGK